MVTFILLVLWIVGGFATWPFVKKWNNSIPVKVAACALWPCTLVVYLIYFLHKLQ